MGVMVGVMAMVAGVMARVAGEMARVGMARVEVAMAGESRPMEESRPISVERARARARARAMPQSLGATAMGAVATVMAEAEAVMAASWARAVEVSRCTPRFQAESKLPGRPCSASQSPRGPPGPLGTTQ